MTGTGPPGAAPPASSPARMLGRALMRRCPLCGGRGIFSGWLHMRDRCPTCSYRFEREEGFFLGSYAINLGITEALLLLLGILPCIVILASNPDAGLGPVIVGGAFAALAAPIAFYPLSRTIWVAIDLMLRPAASHEPTDRD